MVFLNWEQAVDLAEAHNERFRTLIYVAIDSGMRWSELIGLRRSRVDLRNRKVRVTDQLVRLDDGAWLRKEPKTPASVRSITVSNFSAELLAAHLERFAESGSDGLVFPNAAIKPIESASFRNNHFTRALRALTGCAQLCLVLIKLSPVRSSASVHAVGVIHISQK